MSTMLHDAYSAALVTEPAHIKSLIQDRRERGIDRHDEVWEGVYVMAPAPNNEHQELIGELFYILKLINEEGSIGKILPGTNVTDQHDDWTKNYRVPDVVVFRNDNQAVDRGTNWLGGPDLAVEIVSARDRTREKLDFYAKVNTHELLIVDRDPWHLELYRLAEGKLSLVSTSSLQEPSWIASETVPLRMRLQPSEPRPTIEVLHAESDKSWQI